MDTNAWSIFAGDKAEYAIGTPTIEMFCASYKDTHPNKYIEFNSVSSNGYNVKWNTDTTYSSSISEEVATKKEFNGIYNTDLNMGTWLASPSAKDNSSLMMLVTNGYLRGGNCLGGSNYTCVRPIVCLKSGTELISNGNGTYSIK